MLPAIASSMSASVGFGLAASSALADMIWPDWQYPHCGTSSASQARWMLLPRRRSSDRFDGRNLFAGCGGNRRDTGARWLSVDLDRACAAQPHAAAELRAGHVQHVAQRPQQRHIVGDIQIARPSVYVERDHSYSSSLNIRSLQAQDHHTRSAGVESIRPWYRSLLGRELSPGRGCYPPRPKYHGRWPQSGASCNDGDRQGMMEASQVVGNS